MRKISTLLIPDKKRCYDFHINDAFLSDCSLNEDLSMSLLNDLLLIDLISLLINTTLLMAEKRLMIMLILRSGLDSMLST